MPGSKKITLKSSDGVAFRVDVAVASESQTIKHVIEDVCVDDGIPLPNVTAEILGKVLAYCKKHVDASNDLNAWDAKFVKVHVDTLYDIILAADYLNIKSLLDLTCQTVADKITGKNSEEICEIFNIKNNFSPKKEEKALKKIKFKSSDGKAFEVDEVVALESQIIKRMIEDDCADNTIPLPNVTSKILSKVIEHCQRHVEASKAIDVATTSIDLKNWDVDFVKLDQATVIALIIASKANERAITSINNDLKAWDVDFVNVDVDTLFAIILAANYLEIKSLLDLTCQTVADMIKGKTPCEIKKVFNIGNNFTPEEEEEVRRENQWAFE